MYNLNLIIVMYFLINVVSNASCDQLKEEDEQPERFLVFVDDDNQTHILDTQPASTSRLVTPRDFRASAIQFLMYTRPYVGEMQHLFVEDSDSLKMSTFNPNDPTIVIIHGWYGSAHGGPGPVIKEAFLSQMQVNVIVVDWSEYADVINYGSAVNVIPDVGITVSRFLEFLNEETGASFNHMHLIGHSLGAHVAGNAGRYLRQGKLARITALDPAKPYMEDNPNHLKNTDATYVEAIHTNGGTFGTMKRWGTADFYPNGGESQPGCILPSCDHKRSYYLFASSVKYNHLIARKCDSVHDMLDDNCNGEMISMGNSDLIKMANGIYRVDTTDSDPFNPIDS